MELSNDFKKYAIDSLGEECAENLFNTIVNKEQITSIRVNPLKGDSIFFKDLEKVNWSNFGYYLPERIKFTLDPSFHAGSYYVQEASSMYMELIFKAINNIDSSLLNKELNVLDLCAAPGGKSTHLLSLLNKNSLLVSNEVIKSRATILADNIAKWGADNVVVTNNDPADFGNFKGFFDIVLVDAPCSGEGLFRKEPEAIEQWSIENVDLCAKRQRRILSDIWDCLKPEGFLIYSTCTYNKFENDENLIFLKKNLGANIINLESVNDCNLIVTKNGGLQFTPNNVKGEGQFVALVQKTSGETFLKKSTKKNPQKSNDTCNFLPDNFIKILNGDLVKAYRPELFERIRFVEENLRVVLSGIAVATKKGKDYIPHADLALYSEFVRMVEQESIKSGARNVKDGEGNIKGRIAVVEVDKECALKFLAKDAIILKDAPIGYILLIYNGLGLGFVKNLGNRTNNLHPMARRIRMDIK